MRRQLTKCGGCLPALPGVAEVLVGDQRARYSMDHERSGEVIVDFRAE